jgi:hypothetical protein
VIGLADLAAYLRATGWRPTGETWRGAGVWGRDGVELLVPAQEDLQDNGTRVREALEIVAAREGRAVGEVAAAVRRTQVDAVVYRRAAAEPVPLSVGESILGGLHGLVRTAARAAVEGQHLRFAGRPPATVAGLLARSSLVVERASLAVLVPTDAVPGTDRVSGRDVTAQLADAVAAAGGAAVTGEPEAFDATVAGGVSADLCAALGDLAGADHREPFSLAFDWAVAEPAGVPARTVEFAAGAGAVVRAAAARLRRLDVRGDASVEGRVDGLHDEEGGPDRRRVRVRGLLRAGEYVSNGRALWVRLEGERAYDRMVQAYRSGDRVRAAGRLTSRDGRIELSVPDQGIEIDTEADTEDDSGQ